MKQHSSCLSAAGAAMAAHEFFKGGDLLRAVVDHAAHNDVADVVTP